MLTFFATITLAAALHTDMLVTPTWLAENLDNPDVVVLDIATPQQFAEGHITGARPIDPAKLVVTRNGIPDELPSIGDLNLLFADAGIANAKRIVIYSREPLLATRAFFTLDYLRLGDRTAILDGGFARWRAERKAVEQGSLRSYAPMAFDVKPNENVVIRRPILRELLKRPGVILIDARPVDQFSGKENGTNVANAGHIPSAKCFPWNANLRFTDDGFEVLRTPEDLLSTYKGIGLSTANRPVLYCRTGMEASMTYFVLRYLGYQPLLYDGSYTDWNQNGTTARVIATN